MNIVTLIGRLTRDAETRYTQSGMAISRFTLAVDRKVKKEEGKQTADFISCIAFDKRGEFFEKYGRQGVKFAIRGHIQTGSYTDKEGVKRYTTDVVVDEHEFCESKTAAASAPAAKKEPEKEAWMDIPDDVEGDELPFN